MPTRISLALATPILAVALVSACDDSSSPASTGTLDAVSPAPGATMVPTSTDITLTFGQPMMAGMSQYVDLHQGGITGPVMPMACAWSPDMTVLTCTPNAPLAGGTQYTIHAGAGMSDAEGHHVGMGEWQGMGGEWCSSGMMGGMHDGHPSDSMDHEWSHNGHCGMLFTFTTS
jgi:hypothetical protein